MKSKQSYLILIFVLIVSIFSCAGSGNNKNALVYYDGTKWNIELRGKRVPLVHDPGSVFFRKRYNDTMVIPIPHYQLGTDYLIKGNEIAVPEGYYHYQGDIRIIGKKIKVNLLIDNTQDNKLVPEIWNGEYKIVFK